MIAGFGLRHSLGYDEVVLADGDFGGISQLKMSMPVAHESRLGIAFRQPFFSAVAHSLQLFAHSFQRLDSNARARSAIGIVVQMFLPLRHFALQIGFAQHAMARRVGFDARRIDGYRAHLRQSRVAQQTQHLRETIAGSPPRAGDETRSTSCDRARPAGESGVLF
jgi:hypothetical protein